MYSTLCHIEADMSALTRSLSARKKLNTLQLYYQMDYDVVLSFGLTELKAHISWKENVSCFVSNGWIALIVGVRHRGLRKSTLATSLIM